MGVGKTALCRELKKLAAPCAFLDGDWCWDMEPFQVTEETKALVQGNIVTLLAREETLRRRIGGDVAAGLRTWDVLGRSLERLACCRELESALLWTDGLTPAQGARRVWELARRG